MKHNTYLKEYLIDLLYDLETVTEKSAHHPEENTLTHSLQVFELAYQQSADAELWAAALLHDIGKAIDYPHHAIIGADLLKNLLSPRIVWLVKHHLDLLIQPSKTRQHLKNTLKLRDLEKLRQWDLKGRKPHQQTCTVEYSIHTIFQNYQQISH